MSELKAVAGRRRSGLRVDLAYRLARLLIARRQAKRSDDAGPGADCSQGVTGNWDAYMAWRYEALREICGVFVDPDGAVSAPQW